MLGGVWFSDACTSEAFAPASKTLTMRIVDDLFIILLSLSFLFLYS